MATVTGWSPFGVPFNITAVSGTVARTSATRFTVIVNASWEKKYQGVNTIHASYEMVASSGGARVVLNAYGNISNGSSGQFTGTYAINGNGPQTKTIPVVFTNSNPNSSESASTTITLSVNVPALTSYPVLYSNNGGEGGPSDQVKWKDQPLTLSLTKPERTGYIFKGWGTSSDATSAAYHPGDRYTVNAPLTLYAIWAVTQYTVTYIAPDASSVPPQQLKTYDVPLTLTANVPWKSNYIFEGWSTSSTSQLIAYRPGGTYTANASITLYAVWGQTYEKPRIYDIKVFRCDAAKNPSDSGTYFCASFKWETDKEVSKINISYRDADSSSGVYTQSITGTGVIGEVQTDAIGGGVISPEKRYVIELLVSDGAGSTRVTKYVQAIVVPLDLKRGGDGVAFGKPSSSAGVVDTVWPINSTSGTPAIKQVHPTSKKSISFGVDAGGNSRGLYDDTSRTWLISTVDGAGATTINGKTINVISGGDILLKSPSAGITTLRAYGKNKVLWSGGWTMHAGQTITLPEAVSSQPNGIILVWREYSNGASQNSGVHCDFIPKQVVAESSGWAHSISWLNHSGGYFIYKNVFISNTQIKGSDINSSGDTTRTPSGVTTSSNKAVLWKVIGV